MVSLRITLKAPKNHSLSPSPRQRRTTFPRQRRSISTAMFGKSPRLRLFLKRHSTPTTRSPSPGGKPRKDSLLSPKKCILERIDALLNALTDLRPSIDTIQYFLNLQDFDGNFCPECTPEKKSPGTCGRVCALLDPTNMAGVYGILCKHASYISIAKQQKARYHSIIQKMKKAGMRARSRHLTKWENQVEGLRKEMMNRSEKEEGTVLQIKPAPGLDLEWTFEGAWRDGASTDEEVAPDEVLGATLVNAARLALELLDM